MTMTEPAVPYAFKRTLLGRALHFDFLRLRCGTETAFHDAVRELPSSPAQRPYTFAALSEWDALMILPTTELYPEVLNKFYDDYRIDSTIAGTSGYFAYLWDHELNRELDAKLSRFQDSGLAFVISLRFEDWVRRKLGLGAELLFCEYLQGRLRDTALDAIVAHTLGWNDVVIVLHASEDEAMLLTLQSEIRLLTMDRLMPDFAGPDEATSPVFAASYTTVIAGYAALADGRSTLGALAKEVVAATLLVRVASCLEWKVRRKVQQLSGNRIKAADMPTELGHYSFSADISPLIEDGHGGRKALRLLLNTRKFIGAAADESNHGGDDRDALFNSYAETTTILRFRDPSDSRKKMSAVFADDQLREQIAHVKEMMARLPEDLRADRGSPMTAHRFGTVLTTLLDHLADPIRSSVVRHITGFVVETTKLTDLDRQAKEDLCQISEYAMAQATDGIAQFQHDANALGLTGRGGYSRLISAVENYVDDILVAPFGVDEKHLITFGLRLGHAGSTAPFHIDIPFNVLFVPSRWYILLHEVGHIVWFNRFGWMAESLAVYDEMEAEFRVRDHTPKKETRMDLDTAAEFIRTREIIRELFPSLLVFFITCNGNIEEFDRLSLRHLLSRSRAGRGTRELLMGVVLSTLLRLASDSRKKRGSWLARSLERHPKKLVENAVNDAIESISRTLDLPPDKGWRNHVKNTVKNKAALLSSKPFRASVNAAVHSVTRVLGFLAKTLASPEHLGHSLLADLQSSIDEMIADQQIVSTWPERGFDEWISGGVVFAVAPGAHVWANLLHESQNRTRRVHDQAPGMINELAALLSIWHRAAVSVGDDRGAVRVLRQYLVPLDLAAPKW
jgi:hypothetical protein